MNTGSTAKTIAVVESQMKGTLGSIVMAARGIKLGLDVPDDEHALVPRGEGNDAGEYLRDMVLEERTPEDCSYSEFVFSTGGRDCCMDR